MVPLDRIDTHSHILPGIDDGCVDVDDATNCVRQLIAAGYTGTICTPHISPRLYPRNKPTQIRAWVAELQGVLRERGLDYRLWAGGEIVMAADNWDWFERDGFPTLGAGKALLMDWWGPLWPDFADPFLERLQNEGYQPILAHPERMKLPVLELQELVESLTARGVWLQGNLNSLAGGEGEQAAQLSHQWLTEGRYYILASDTHHPDRLEGRFQGLQKAIDLVGEAQVAELISRRTRAIAEGTY